MHTTKLFFALAGIFVLASARVLPRQDDSWLSCFQGTADAEKVKDQNAGQNTGNNAASSSMEALEIRSLSAPGKTYHRLGEESIAVAPLNRQPIPSTGKIATGKQSESNNPTAPPNKQRVSPKPLDI
jgi:hypothetical protein